MTEKTFTKEEQLDLFSDLFASQELVELYIKSGKDFCEEAQLKMFEFEAPVNEEMVISYIDGGHRLCEKAELKLFELPSAELVLETYCFGKMNILQPASQMQLLASYDRFPKFVKRYIRAYKKTPYLSEAFVAEATKQGLLK